MNKLGHEEEKIAKFLMSYPDAIPSPQEKARTVRRVEREIVKGRVGRMSTLDIIFALLFVSVMLVLTLFNGMLPSIQVGQILNQSYQTEFTHDILLYIFIGGLLTTPLLLTILPVNRGGNH
ncbi:MAG: hypothetical protein PHZ03_06685 [Syntrophomonas sp.]|nr:hypothetical protein [Syntrophomonas sp.]